LAARRRAGAAEGREQQQGAIPHRYCNTRRAPIQRDSQ